jgi:A/G-specific adenine glycosylase
MNAPVSETDEITGSGFFVAWFEEDGRDFPWREDEVSPFQLLITEMLLRQTQATQVDRLWKDFMSRFSTPKDLSEADHDELFNRVEELGFGNQRVEALTSASTYLLENHNGQVPTEKEDLLDIPHIGPYASHAVLCFAHGEPVPVVDSNILRLFCRLTGTEVNRIDIRREPWAWEMAEELLPEDPEKAQAHNYGLLDFTAAVCKSQSPQCRDCPISSECAYGVRLKTGKKITHLP